MQVTTEELSPGMFTRMEVVEPPYMAPYQMPAKRMMAVAGGRPKVNGSRTATLPAVPMPGRTPTRVPIRTPTKQ